MRNTGREDAVANATRKSEQADRRRDAMKADRIVVYKDRRRI